jgi:hypothetical protein
MCLGVCLPLKLNCLMVAEIFIDTFRRQWLRPPTFVLVVFQTLKQDYRYRGGTVEGA